MRRADSVVHLQHLQGYRVWTLGYNGQEFECRVRRVHCNHVLDDDYLDLARLEDDREIVADQLDVVAVAPPADDVELVETWLRWHQEHDVVALDIPPWAEPMYYDPRWFTVTANLDAGNGYYEFGRISQATSAKVRSQGLQVS